MDDFRKWTTSDVLRWKLLSAKYGGGDAYLYAFKDAWIVHNRTTIVRAAAQYRIPPILLAGIAWAEVAGDPHFIDFVALNVRSFDWSGPELVDKYLTITRRPYRTSFGSVSIQLGVVARTIGMQAESLTHAQMLDLAKALDSDVYNLFVVAKHMRELLIHDFPEIDKTIFTDEHMRISGSRYNRGLAESLTELKRHLSYGNALVKRKGRIEALMLLRKP